MFLFFFQIYLKYKLKANLLRIKVFLKTVTAWKLHSKIVLVVDVEDVPCELNQPLPSVPRGAPFFFLENNIRVTKKKNSTNINEILQFHIKKISFFFYNLLEYLLIFFLEMLKVCVYVAKWVSCWPLGHEFKLNMDTVCFFFFFSFFFC